jgi:hypothetical protein
VDLAILNYYTQVVDAGLLKVAFGCFEKKRFILKSLQYLVHNSPVQGKVGGGPVWRGNEEVVHVDVYVIRILVQEVTEDSMHALLKGAGSVPESEGHNIGQIKAEGGDEGYLPLVFGLDPYVVVSPPNVQGGKKLLAAKLFQYSFDPGEWVRVWYCPLVDFPVILYWS